MPTLNATDILHMVTDLYMENLRMKDLRIHQMKQVEELQQKFQELEAKTSRPESVPAPAGPRPVPQA